MYIFKSWRRIKSYQPFNYDLPDGNQVILNDERIKCTEILFEPSIRKKKGKGIAKTCYDLIQKCDIYAKKELYNNICLSGGNTLFNGFLERFRKEMEALVPISMKKEIKVIASKERKFLSWIGGSVLSSISTFKKLWILKKIMRKMVQKSLNEDKIKNSFKEK